MRKLKQVLVLIIVVCVSGVLPGCTNMKQNNHAISQQPSSKITSQSQAAVKIDNKNQQDNLDHRTNTAALVGFGVGAALGVGIIALVVVIGLPAVLATGSICVG